MGAPRLHDRVVDAVGRRIVGGELAPGEVVVPAGVRAGFRVSASVVREAFRALEGKGLLQAKSKIGTRVAPRSQWDFLDPQVIGWRMDGAARDDQITEFLDLRRAVEPVAAQLMAENAAQSSVNRLRGCLNRLKAAAERGDHSGFVQADVEFHTTLVAESGNAMLGALRAVAELPPAVRDPLYFPFAGPVAHPPALHEELLAAIAGGSRTAQRIARDLLR